MTVAIIDYGSGNLHSAAKAFERAARTHENPQKIAVTRDPEAVYRADRLTQRLDRVHGAVHVSQQAAGATTIVAPLLVATSLLVPTSFRCTLRWYPPPGEQTWRRGGPV